MLRSKSKPAKKSPKLAASANGNLQSAEVLTLDEAAAYLRVSPEDILKMISTDALPGRRFGSEWRFSKAAIQVWLSRPGKKKGILAHAGEIKDDPYMEEMLRDIYKQRGRPEVPEAEES